jgi:hypothetical protein
MRNVIRHALTPTGKATGPKTGSKDGQQLKIDTRDLGSKVKLLPCEVERGGTTAQVSIVHKESMHAPMVRLKLHDKFEDFFIQMYLSPAQARWVALSLIEASNEI